MISYCLEFSIVILFLTTMTTFLFPSPVKSSQKNVFQDSSKIDAPIVPGFKYIGKAGPEYLYIPDKEYTRDEGQIECQKLQQYTGRPGHLISITDTKTEVFHLLYDKFPDIKDFWIFDLYMYHDGREALIFMHPDTGPIQQDITGHGLALPRPNKTSTDQRKVREKRNDANFNADILTRKAGDTSTFGQMTLMETHYPWIYEEGNKNSTCILNGCKPIKCTIKTHECRIQSAKCYLKLTNCDIIESPPCSVVCEECDITQPNCWTATTECEVTKHRKCTVEAPECHVITPPCTVERPPCVTKYPNCTVKEEEKICQVPVTCAHQLGHKNCTIVPKDCDSHEIAAGIENCTSLLCGPEIICLEPVYCRKSAVVCPSPVTFCPPENVHCPPPTVSCDKPITHCTSPEFNCDIDKVVCENPTVNCTSPKIICPPLITQCDHPQVTCPPPDLDCPPPEIQCEDPEPCKIPPSHNCTQAPTQCPGEDCDCVVLRKEGVYNYERHGIVCDYLARPICVTTMQ